MPLPDLSLAHYESYEFLADARYDAGYTRSEADASALQSILDAYGIDEPAGTTTLRPYQSDAVDEFDRYSNP